MHASTEAIFPESIAVTGKSTSTRSESNVEIEAVFVSQALFFNARKFDSGNTQKVHCDYFFRNFQTTLFLKLESSTG